MKPLLLISLLCFGILDVQSQAALTWAHRFGNTESTQINGIALDEAGNIYSIGSFFGTVDFDPGTAIVNLTSSGDYDVFITKLDASGNFIWAKRMGGDNIDYGNAISLDALGNIYVVGDFWGTADFDPNAGTTNLLSLGSGDGFICKLDENGNLMWAAKVGGIGFDEAKSVMVDSNGDVLFSGYFHNDGNFNPGPGVFILTNNGGVDGFITKLDAGGIFIWAKSFGGPEDDLITDLAIDADDHVIATGWFSSTVDFDPGAGTFNLTSAGMEDAFILRLDVSGNLSWALRFGANESDIGLGVQVDDDGNIVSTGYFRNTVDFDPGQGTSNLTSAGMEDIFISKISSNLNYLWAKRIGNAGSEQSNDIGIGANGNVYTTGYFSGTVDFDPGAGIASITAVGQSDGFINELSSSGQFVSNNHFSGDEEINPLTIVTDTAGNLYGAGYFHGSADFDPGYNDLNLVASGSDDAFLFKLHACVPSTSLISVTSCEYYVSPSGLFSWTDSGTYLDTLGNRSGCDSIITVNLTILHQSEAEITVSACDSYLAPGGDILTTSAIYTDTISNAVGCDSVIVINLTINALDTSVVYEENYSLTAQLVGANYQWIDCGEGNQSIPEAIEQIFYPVASGSYAVIISVNDCVDTSSCYNVIIAGFKAIGIDDGLHLFPNPAKEYTLVEIADVFKDGWLRILDVNGREMYHVPYHGEKEMRVDLKLAAGVYFVRMQDAERYVVTKLVIE